MFLNRVWLKLRKYFIELPELELGFQLTPQRVAGCLIKNSEKSKSLTFINQLPEGCLEPSFHKRNIRQIEVLKEILSQGFQKLEAHQRDMAFLPPEMSLRVFVLSFSSLPSHEEEAEKVILFATRKQFPLLPQDIRLTYSIIPENGKIRVVGALARQAVIEEYEQVFDSLGYKVKLILPPTLSLYPLVRAKGKGLVINIESDSWGAFVFEEEKVVFYRQKPFSFDKVAAGEKNWEGVFQEVETTVRFIEDKEKIELDQIILRNTQGEKKGYLLDLLETKFGLPVIGIEEYVGINISPEEKAIFAPVFGALG